jgi:hypothetical protein
VAAAPPQSGRLTCTVHTIRFHHGVPTYGCALMRLLPGPYTITEDRCQGGAYSYDLEIDTMYSGAYCFYSDHTPNQGGDYLGLGSSPYGDLYYVTQIASLPLNTAPNGYRYCGAGWVMAYEPPYAQGTGYQFYYANCTTYNDSNAMFNGDDKVTQVYITPQP